MYPESIIKSILPVSLEGYVNTMYPERSYQYYIIILFRYDRMLILFILSGYVFPKIFD